jgi:hypothetical protein
VATAVPAPPACVRGGAPLVSRPHAPLKKQGRRRPTINCLLPASQMSGAGGVPDDDGGHPYPVPASAADQHDDDASSVEEECQLPSTASFAYDKAFPTFGELSSSVAAFAGITHSFTPSDNSRTATRSLLPTQWLRTLFANIGDSKAVKYSGYLYCPHKCGSGDCPFKVPYKLDVSGNWKVLPSAVWAHNHDVHPTAANLPSVSGIVHLFSVDDLSVPQSSSIVNYLDSGLSTKLIRRKFREKFSGYEVRARVVKTMRERFLREKYGGDRHQINELLKKLQEDCGGVGGTCLIEHSQELELERLFFQIPLLREVGKYFGIFSIIDTTHNMTMYDRQLATFNVSALFMYCFMYCFSIPNL